MIIEIPLDDLQTLTSLGITLPHLVRTLHDYGHPIIANPSNLIRNEDIDLKGLRTEPHQSNYLNTN